MSRHFKRHITRRQCVDTGMAAVLICLLIAYFGESRTGAGVAILVLIVNMVYPAFFRIPAVFWFGLSNILGKIVSSVLLTIIFAVLVIPVGIFRRILGADPLLLKQWKADDSSVFRARDHQFSPEELEKPY